MILDLQAPKDEQIQVLVPFLEAAAMSSDETYIQLTNASTVLATRILRGWGKYINKNMLSAEGAFYYYQCLVEDTHAVLP